MFSFQIILDYHLDIIIDIGRRRVVRGFMSWMLPLRERGGSSVGKDGESDVESQDL
jgi:hypothetical protein